MQVPTLRRIRASGVYAGCALSIFFTATLTFLIPPPATAGDVISVSLRWCAVRGSPAVDNPGGVGEPDTDSVLWRRQERATDRVYTPGAQISFRSAFTREAFDRANFPIIDDLNPPLSGGPVS